MSGLFFEAPQLNQVTDHLGKANKNQTAAEVSQKV